jgi:hypothetical protein
MIGSHSHLSMMLFGLHRNVQRSAPERSDPVGRRGRRRSAPRMGLPVCGTMNATALTALNAPLVPR